MIRVLIRNAIHQFNAVKIQTRRLSTALNYTDLQFVSKIPEKPTPLPAYASHRVIIDADTIRLLERLSLVNIEDEYAFDTSPWAIGAVN